MTEHTHKSQTILTVAVLLFAVFQFSQILMDRANLKNTQSQLATRLAEMDKTIADGQGTLDKLNAIAVGTQRLAEAGNANAKQIVEDLAKAGIKINPNYKEEQAKGAAAGSAAPAAPAAAGEAPAAPAPTAPAEPAPAK